MNKEDSGQLTLLAETFNGGRSSGRGATTAEVSAAFEPGRLTQARRLVAITKRALGDILGVSPAAVGQWEAGTSTPRADHVAKLAYALDVSPEFFAAGRLYVRLDLGAAHFRSLRSTPAAQRAKAVAFAEQIWELTYALEKRVRLPPVDLPGFSAEEVQPAGYAGDPLRAAKELRSRWTLGLGPIPHLVRTMERHGVIVTLLPFAGGATAKVDAFSTSHLPRPVVALTPDRANDIYRHRFTAAHELGHLLLHGDTAPGDPMQEREADAFAAELLTPKSEILGQLPQRMDLAQLERLGRTWGVSVESLVYRCKEVGLISDAVYRRTFQRLNQLRKVGLFPPESVDGFTGEIPLLLNQAFSVAEKNGLHLQELANELKLSLPRLRFLLGNPDTRPTLTIV